MPALINLVGLFRRFRSFILGRPVEIVGQCRLCGNCCRDICIKDRGRWMTTLRQYERLCREEPVYARFKPRHRDEDGFISFACSKLGPDNFCTCYDDRLPLCRNYPTKELYYVGGSLGADCGFSFKATTFRDVFGKRKPLRGRRFSDVLDSAIQHKDNQSS